MPHSNQWKRVGALAFALVLSAGPALHAEAPAAPADARPRPSSGTGRFAGRPLAEVLADSRESGLDLIFSNDLVRPEMVVTSEPIARTPRGVLQEILAPFGLAAVDGPGTSILVIRAPTWKRSAQGPADGPPDRSDDRPPAGPPFLRERIRVDAPRDDGPAPVSRVDREASAPVPALGDDAMRVLARLPGITSAETTARFGVRGGAGNEALILLDGLEIDEPYHLQDFFAFSSILDAKAIDRIDVMSGVFPAQYGGRVSGVVDMWSTDATGPARTVIGASLLDLSLLSSGGFDGGGSWLVSARAWRPDNVVDTITLQGDGLDPAFNDLLAKAEWPLPGGALLAAHLLASRDDLNYQTDPGDGRVSANDDRRYAWLTWNVPWTTRLWSETVLSSTRAGRGRIGGAAEPGAGILQVDDDRSFGAFGLKQDWLFAAGERVLLKWGFDTRRLEAQYAYRSHMDGAAALNRDLILEPSGVESGAYVAARFHPLTPLTLEVGVRRDHQSITGDSETSPRLNLACAVGTRSALHAGWGLFHQAQGINELQIEDGVTAFFPAQSAEQWDLGFDHRIAESLTFGASMYQRSMSSVRPYYENLLDPFQLFPEAEPDRVPVAPDAAQARGVELTLASDPGQAVAWRGSYALASSEDHVDGAWVPRSWDQRHTVDFSLTWRHADRWVFGLAGVYHTGWPTTDVTAAQIPVAGGGSVIQPIYGERNALRYPPYHRLDVGVTRWFALGGGVLGLKFQVMNVYGRANVCCVSDTQFQPLPDGSVRVDRIEGHWPRQLPVFAVTFEF